MLTTFSVKTGLFLLVSLPQIFSSPLGQKDESIEDFDEIKDGDSLYNSFLISKMDPVLQSYFNKEDNQQLTRAVNNVRRSLDELFEVLQTENEKRRTNGQRLARQDDEEPEVLVQIGQLLGSIFAGGFRKTFFEKNFSASAIKRRVEGLIHKTKAPSKTTTPAPVTTKVPETTKVAAVATTGVSPVAVIDDEYDF